MARDDGHGFEIKGISGQMMRLFSSHRESITTDLRARAARFEQRYGRAPSQRELAQLAQASNFKERAAKDGAGLRAPVQRMGRQARATRGVPLASVAPSGWRNDTRHATAHARPRLDGTGPRREKADALTQQENSTWTRADLVKYLVRVLPRMGMYPADRGPARGPGRTFRFWAWFLIIKQEYEKQWS